MARAALLAPVNGLKPLLGFFYGDKKMPLTKAGKKTLKSMKQEYGPKKGESVFYASINKGTIDKSKMEGKKSGSGGKRKKG